MLSPIIGASLYDQFGFSTTITIASAFIIFMALVYFFVNAKGFRVLKHHKMYREQLDELLQMGKG